MSIVVTPGVGATVSCDTIGTAHAPASGENVQWVKMDLGAPGASSPLAYGQALMAASLPVVIASDQSSLPVTVSASTAGGATLTKYTSAAGAPGGLVNKASAGTLYGYRVTNTNVLPRFIKFYNIGTTPVIGSTPVVLTIGVPGANSGNVATVIDNIPPVGALFSAGIAFVITGAIADIDTTAVTAGDLMLTILSK